jgi:N-acetylglucosamine kinase-like BadF-type ATPase
MNPRAAVLAFDGGNSKTDVALVEADGTVLAHTRGPGVPAPTVGMAHSQRVLGELVEKVAHDAGIALLDQPIAQHTAAYLAGVDIPQELAAMHAALLEHGWSQTTTVDNDTFAVFRAGTTRHWGIGVVSGAGINAVGIGPDGRVARFPSIGELTGDFGGSGDLSNQVMWSAIRDEDGRGRATVLRQAVIEHFGRSSVEEVAIAMHTGELSVDDRLELVRVLFRVADQGDPIAIDLVDRQAHEVALMTKSIVRRLDLTNTKTDVVLGGGVLTSREPLLMRLIDGWMETEAPNASVRVNTVPAITGAALLGLDYLSIGVEAEEKLRAATWTF